MTDLPTSVTSAIIAHIDSRQVDLGRSPDSILRLPSGREMTRQVLDSMEHRARARHHHQSQTVAADLSRDDGKTYQLNLVDTPAT